MAQLNETTRQKLVESSRQLQAVLDAVESILNGQSVQKAVDGLPDVSRKTFEYNLDRLFQPYIRARLVTVEDLPAIVTKLRSPGEKLLIDVLGLADSTRDPDDTLVVLPPFDEDLLWRLTDESLTPRGSQVMSMAYGRGTGAPMTFADIARQLDLTALRISQIHAKSLRVLRQPAKLMKLFPDVETDTACANLASYTEARLRSARRRLDLISANHETAERIERFLTIPENQRTLCTQMIGADLLVGKPEKDKTPLEDLDFSVRTFNCLYRSGIRYMEDMLGMTEADLMRIRNLGRKSMEEIIAVLKDKAGYVVPTGD